MINAGTKSIDWPLLLILHKGFLTTGDELMPGNYGLLDQIESLKWMRNNIAYFHGDASKVTLFGSSAGAASIGLLIVSPLAQGKVSILGAAFEVVWQESKQSCSSEELMSQR